MPTNLILLTNIQGCVVKDIVVKSPAFSAGEMIPEKYTSDGANVSPALILRNIPDETRSLALIIDDPDAPVGTWVHWLVWNIPPSAKLSEDTIRGVEGLNSFRRHHYEGPCPPSGIHRYFFKVYALDTILQIPSDSGCPQVERAMTNHIVGYGELIGLYGRDNKSGL